MQKRSKKEKKHKTQNLHLFRLTFFISPVSRGQLFFVDWNGEEKFTVFQKKTRIKKIGVKSYYYACVSAFREIGLIMRAFFGRTVEDEWWLFPNSSCGISGIQKAHTNQGHVAEYTREFSPKTYLCKFFFWLEVMWSLEIPKNHPSTSSCSAFRLFFFFHNCCLCKIKEPILLFLSNNRSKKLKIKEDAPGTRTNPHATKENHGLPASAGAVQRARGIGCEWSDT